MLIVLDEVGLRKRRFINSKELDRDEGIFYFVNDDVIIIGIDF